MRQLDGSLWCGPSTPLKSKTIFWNFLNLKMLYCGIKFPRFELFLSFFFFNIKCMISLNRNRNYMFSCSYIEEFLEVHPPPQYLSHCVLLLYMPIYMEFFTKLPLLEKLFINMSHFLNYLLNCFPFIHASFFYFFPGPLGIATAVSQHRRPWSTLSLATRSWWWRQSRFFPCRAPSNWEGGVPRWRWSRCCPCRASSNS